MAPAAVRTQQDTTKRRKSKAALAEFAKNAVSRAERCGGRALTAVPSGGGNQYDEGESGE